LQPATLANGCMQFVRGSHRDEVLPHHPINNNPHIHGLEVDAAHTTTAVACPLPAGGATVHSNRTLHYAGANHTDEPRRAYILLFGVPPSPRSEPRDFYWNTNKTTARQKRADQMGKQKR
jgi:ectoine hydroxylase-related dioxygenase (phytanoyl-CoA dioxygenase family)